MQLQVILDKEAMKLNIFVRQGTFDQAQTAITQITALLRSKGIELDGEPVIEQHRHDEFHAHTIAHQPNRVR
jgi:hypothetical protein